MNIANQLTLGRIFLIFIAITLASIREDFPLFYPVFKIPEATVYGCHLASFIILVVAMLTDMLDGYLARKLKIVTDFGKLMDPLADKILVTAFFLILVDYQLMPAWIVVVILSREFLVTGLRTLAAAHGVVIDADRWGKLKTILQMVVLSIGGAAWVHLLPVELSVNNPTTDLNLWLILWQVSLWGITFITVWSGIGYFYRYRQLFTRNW